MMDGFSVFCLLLSGGGVLFGLIQRLRARRQLAQMNRMLDRALEGQFQETTFDESAPSALEAKLARFLNGSAASARGLAEERGKIAALIADISHQTKTPIAALLLYSSLLAESPLPPEQREQARAVQAQAEKLRFLIETLVKSSRLDSGILVLTPALHPVDPLLEEAAAQYAGAAAEKNISLTVQPAQGSARFDQKWTAEALGNVVDNAVKYTPPGGSVALSAVFYELFCCIQVSDTGPGVPEGEQARIFSRFYRGEGVRDQEGLGLGLFLTRSILTREGGYVKLSSKSGIDRHQKDHIHILQNVIQGRQRRSRIQGNSRLHPCFFDSSHRPVQMRTCLRVDRDYISSRIRKRADIAVRIADHQMYVKHHHGISADRLNDRKSQ